MAITVKKRRFGITKAGEPVDVYTAKSDVLCVELLEYGATIRSLLVRNGDGWTDVVLGYDTLREYEENDGFVGACIGRVGFRIGSACFQLIGRSYPLA